MAPKSIKSANKSKKLKIKLGLRSKSLKTLVRDKRLRLTNRQNYTNAEFESALFEIRSGRLSQRQVSQKIDIPLTTLNNFLNGISKSPTIRSSPVLSLDIKLVVEK